MRQQINEELTLLDLKQDWEGFHSFISSWILRRSGKTIVVDPGPATSIPQLREELSSTGLDYIFLTHIHIDHAGGIGQLLSAYPQAKVFAYQPVHKHLINPQKLIEGSRATLGDKMVDMYGEILPIKPEQILSEEAFSEELAEFRIIETPGHASHHISFVDEKYCFCGEALGVLCSQAESYLRPATPPKFILEIYKESIQRLSALPERLFCFGHFGAKLSGGDLQLKALEQIDIWVKTIKTVLESKESSQLDKEFIHQARKELMKNDKSFAPFLSLPTDIQQREISFISNSILGIAKYLQSKER